MVRFAAPNRTKPAQSPPQARACPARPPPSGGGDRWRDQPGVNRTGGQSRLRGHL